MSECAVLVEDKRVRSPTQKKMLRRRDPLTEMIEFDANLFPVITSSLIAFVDFE